MNKLFKYIISIFIFCIGYVEASAQVAVPENWDQDIYALRHAAVPGFNVPIDDYMQYAPAAVMVALKACGNEGRSDWAQMLVADAFSVASMSILMFSS